MTVRRNEVVSQEHVRQLGGKKSTKGRSALCVSTSTEGTGEGCHHAGSKLGYKVKVTVTQRILIIQKSLASFIMSETRCSAERRQV